MTPATPATPSALERYRLLLPLAALLTLLVGFAKLAEDVWSLEPFRWDAPVLAALHSARTPLLDGLMLGLTWAGGAAGMALLAALVLAWLLYRRRAAQALFFTLAAGGAALLNPLLKAVFHRARPDLWPQLTPERDYSFPSGHAMGSLAVVAALVVLAWPTRWRWWVAIPGGLFVLGVGLSRLYLGVHFPSDVLAGWLAGLLWVSAVALGLRRRAARSA
ncbi:MAG: phosphatase PAP2 family protein [Thermaceae bacterium]|nr:phosphatase PAP2 family protein [Thermaceae bacterium]